MQTVSYMIIKNSELGKSLDNCMNSGLHWAVKRTNQKMVLELLWYSDVNKKNIFDKTPIDYATEIV